MSPKKKSDIKKNISFIALISLFIVLLDQITKLAIVKNFQLAQSIPLINNFFHLTYIQNTGAGFGFLQGNNSLLIGISIIVIGLILYFYDTIPKHKFAQTATALIIGGALGNLIDRIRLGYVIDFFDFRIWPAFNVADSAITVGVIILIIFLIKEK